MSALQAQVLPLPLAHLHPFSLQEDKQERFNWIWGKYKNEWLRKLEDKNVTQRDETKKQSGGKSREKSQGREVCLKLQDEMPNSLSGLIHLTNGRGHLWAKNSLKQIFYFTGKNVRTICPK